MVPTIASSSTREADMTEQANLALVRRAYEAFNAADGPTLVELMDEGCVQHMSGSHRFSGLHKGRDAVLGMYGEMGALTGGTLRAVPERFFANGDLVAIVHRESARRGDRALDTLNCLLFRLEDGRIVELTEMGEDDGGDGAGDEDAFWA
jgi:ketosteroid isomerase-like protein